MSGENLTVITTLTKIVCGSCGGVYAIAERYRADCQKDAKSWTCPYCACSWGYPGKTEAQKLKEQLAEEQKRLARERQQHDQTKADRYAISKKLVSTKGVVTRLKRRAKAGMCPCCRRTFQNLAAHMKTQHPKFAEEEKGHAKT